MKNKSLKAAAIYITKTDHESLSWLIENTRERTGEADGEYLNRLEEELDRAEIVNPEDVPADLITMRSTVRLKDLKSGKTVMYSLVFPAEANSGEGHISVLAPIGTALLGYKCGDVIESQVPSGLRRLKVKQIVYQPEAAGNYQE